MPTKIKSPGLRNEKKFLEKVKTLQLTEQQALAVFFFQDRLRKAFEQRESNWEYFDGLSYCDDYYLNRQAANTYLRPKINDDEVRVNTTTTEKKIEVIQNELLALNLEPEIRAYDDNDNLMEDLGEQFTDIVQRTNEIEKDSDMYQDAIHELLTQRAVFIKEIWRDEVVRDKRLKKIGVRRIQRAEKRLVSGLKVFLGDITIPWYRFDDQPYILEYDRISWQEAKKRFPKEKFPMMQFVHPGNSGGNQHAGCFDLRFGQLQSHEVELITYKSYNDDELMHVMQAVPLDPVGTKLSWEYEGYNMKMFGLKTMSRDFAYCKPLTASAKVLQALDNEFLRNLIRKARQAIEPPTGTKAGRIFSKDVWSPGAMTQGMTKDDFEILINHDGVTASEFNMFELIKQEINEAIGAGPQQQGISGEGSQTATESQILQRQFAIQLGLSVLAVMAMKRDMSFLRIYNLLENATQPIGKAVDPLTDKIINTFRQFTKQDANLGEGRLGTKQILFMDRDLNGEEKQQIFDKEEELEKIGKSKRFKTINVKKLLEIPINWFVVVTKKLKESDALDKIMFSDSLEQAINVATVAQRPLNGDAIVQDFGQTWKKQDWFQKAAPQQIAPVGTGGGSEQGKQLKKGVEPSKKPSLNTIEGQQAIA